MSYASAPRIETLPRLVTIIYKSLPRYRIPFFEALKPELQRRGVGLRVIYGEPHSVDAKKRDTGTIAWATRINNRNVQVGPQSLLWQPCLSLIRDSDLVIVEQASKLLLNYVLLLRQRLGGSKVAFWGHGENYQRHAASRTGEAAKRLVSRWPHWWFAYTESSAAVVRRLPYPPERITVVQNAIDTSALRAWRASIDGETISTLRARWNVQSSNVAIFSGGLYQEKRIGFLLDCAHAIRRTLCDFELIVIGAGPDQHLVEQEEGEHSWIHYAGPRFDSEKVQLFSLARVMLLPGLVGLGVLDSFALEVPLVTIDLPYHSPEIEYLKNGENGIKLAANTSAEEYASAVVDLLTDEARLRHLQTGCRSAAGEYTLEAMVNRFADGVLEALHLDHAS